MNRFFRLFVTLLMFAVCLFSLVSLFFDVGRDFRNLTHLLITAFLGGVGLVYSGSISNKFKRYLLIAISFFVLIGGVLPDKDVFMVLYLLGLLAMVVIIRPWKRQPPTTTGEK